MGGNQWVRCLLLYCCAGWRFLQPASLMPSPHHHKHHRRSALAAASSATARCGVLCATSRPCTMCVGKRMFGGGGEMRGRRDLEPVDFAVQHMLMKPLAVDPPFVALPHLFCRRGSTCRGGARGRQWRSWAASATRRQQSGGSSYSRSRPMARRTSREPQQRLSLLGRSRGGQATRLLLPPLPMGATLAAAGRMLSFWKIWKMER